MGGVTAQSPAGSETESAPGNSDGKAPKQGSRPAAYMAPPLRLTRVTCDKGHDLIGLFVLFRVKPKVPLGPAFELAVVGNSNGKGYLMPAEHPSVPFSVHSLLLTQPDQVTDRYRLLPDQEYEFYFIHHPDLELAKQLQNRLGVSPASVPPQVLKLDADGVIKIKEDPSCFLPQGHAMYKGWQLFCEMPCKSCQPVKEQVARLQVHLGVLRYPVGSSHYPYLPSQKSEEAGVFNAGNFDVRTLNAVFMFQRDVRGKRAFRVTVSKPKTLPHAAMIGPGPTYEILERFELDGRKGAWTSMDRSWQYLSGADEEGAAGDPPEAEDGVINEKTAAAIATWLDNGLRRRNPILVAITEARGAVYWLRAEAARAWYVWNELAQCLRSTKGIFVNHTFRSILADIEHAGYGRAVTSLHKPGLAMDLGLANTYYEPAASWPVLYQKEPGPGGGAYWRLFILCQQLIPKTPEEAQQMAAQVLARLDELEKRLLTVPLLAGDPEDLLGGALKRLRDALGKQPQDFFLKYFVSGVKPWKYDSMSEEGGQTGEEVTATEYQRKRYLEELAQGVAKTERSLASPMSASHKKRVEETLANQRRQLEEASTSTAADGERTFLDLTLLGETVKLSRIPSFRGGWQYGHEAIKTSDLAKMAKELRAARALDSEQEDAKWVTIKRESSSRRVLLADLDIDFIEDWSRELADKSVKASLRLGREAHPELVVNASWGNSRVAKELDTIASLLKKFSGKKFYGRAPSDEGPLLRTGEEWSKVVGELPAYMEKNAPIKQSSQGGSPDKKIKSAPMPLEKRQIRLLPIVLSAKTGSEKPESDAAPQEDAERLLVLKPGDVAQIPKPGSPIGMEWWHFQRFDLMKEKRWGESVCELGWAEECLGIAAIPALYHRVGVGYSADRLNKVFK